MLKCRFCLGVELQPSSDPEDGSAAAKGNLWLLLLVASLEPRQEHARKDARFILFAALQTRLSKPRLISQGLWLQVWIGRASKNWDGSQPCPHQAFLTKKPVQTDYITVNTPLHQSLQTPYFQHLSYALWKPYRTVKALPQSAKTLRAHCSRLQKHQNRLAEIATMKSETITALRGYCNFYSYTVSVIHAIPDDITNIVICQMHHTLTHKHTLSLSLSVFLSLFLSVVISFILSYM